MSRLPAFLLSVLLLAPGAAQARIADDAPVPETGPAVHAAWLGVSLQEVTPEIARALKLDDARGALVGDVAGESPASRAGIEKGDVILRVGGNAVERPEDVSREVRRREPGEGLAIEVVRDGKTRSLSASLGERPTGPAPDAEPKWRWTPREPRGRGSLRAPRTPRALREESGPPAPPMPRRAMLGVRVQPMDDDLAGYFGAKAGDGVLVAGVDPESPASKAGLKSGDVIKKLDEDAVDSPEALVRAVRNHEPGDSVTLTILRQRRESELRVELGSPVHRSESGIGWDSGRPGLGRRHGRTGGFRHEFRGDFGPGLPMVRQRIGEELRRMHEEIDRLRGEIRELRDKDR